MFANRRFLPTYLSSLTQDEDNLVGKYFIRYCVFCKNNGESEEVYSSHNLKKDNGIIICPKLRKYTCPLCQASGDLAHTKKYCPYKSTFPNQYNSIQSPLKEREFNIFCVFCKKNGETPSIYNSHSLKDNRGNTTCPVLKNYKCPGCKATGSKAHTLAHCPNKFNQGYAEPICKGLKSKPIGSNRQSQDWSKERKVFLPADDNTRMLLSNVFNTPPTTPSTPNDFSFNMFFS